MEIYVATIEHRNGVNHYAAKTESALLNAIDKYVKYWWDEELPEKSMPEDMGDRRDTYFMAAGEDLTWDLAELIE